MATYLNIPTQLKIGFKPSYNSSKLCYITYINAKGQIAKENSWESWRDKTIPVLDTENVPTSGFSIVSGGGGRRWSSRQAYCQLLDPRGFEFQISYENLLFILSMDSYIDGKLQGEYVYGWDGANLILTPTISDDYIYSQKVTNELKQFNPKDCEVGHSYYSPKYPNNVFMFIGALPYVNYRNIEAGYYEKSTKPNIVTPVISKKYIFRVISDSYRKFEILSSSIQLKLIESTDYPVGKESQINKYINEYYDTICINSQTLTTKKITNIESFSIINSKLIFDISDKVKDAQIYPVEKWSIDLMKKGSTNLINDNNTGIYYVTDDNRSIYRLNIKRQLKIGRNYSSKEFDSYYSTKKTEAEAIEYVKKYAKYELDIHISYVYKISDDNTHIKVYNNSTCIDYNHLNTLPENGKFYACRNDRYAWTLHNFAYLNINNNRILKL